MAAVRWGFTDENLRSMTGPYNLHGNPINPGNGPLPLPADSPMRASVHLVHPGQQGDDYMTELTARIKTSGTDHEQDFTTNVPARYMTIMGSWGYLTGCYESEGMLTLETNGDIDDDQVAANAFPLLHFSQNSPSFITMMKHAHVAHGVHTSRIFNYGFSANTNVRGECR
jgi:hypothetical protein